MTRQSIVVDKSGNIYDKRTMNDDQSQINKCIAY